MDCPRHQPDKTPGERGSAVRNLVARLSTSLSREKLGASLRTRSFRSGGFTALSCVIAIAVAVLAVTAADQLPASIRLIDLSRDQPTSLSDSSRSYLADLDEDVTIYLIAPEGEEDDYTQMLLENYEDASEHVSVVQRDPDLYPTFARSYTDEELASGSLIITCGDDFRVISSGDLYTVDYTTYSYQFAGEEAITSAIAALTSDDLPQVYLTTGHGETDLPDGATSSLETANFETSSLNLLSQEVPDDADAVICFSPESDFSADEEERILEYLEEGGHFILITSYDRGDTPNLDEIMDTYGMTSQDGVVVEGDMTHMLVGYPYYLLPDIASSDATADFASRNAYVLVPLAHGIVETDSHRSTLTVEPFLITSQSAYLKTAIDTSETLDYEEGDIAGQTAVGMLATEETDEGETRVIWISSPYMLSDGADSTVGGSNTTLFTELLTWITDSDTVGAELVGKDLGSSTITVDAGTATALSALFIGAVPATALIIGLVIWRRRKAR